jgi:hypothetical protein
VLPVPALPVRPETATASEADERSLRVISVAVSASARRITGQPATAGPVRGWLARRSISRRLFAESLAQHERAGYHVSPASWRRLKEEARRLAGTG